MADVEKLKSFVVKNEMSLSAATLGKIAELANTSRTDNAAFFTSKTLITEMMKSLPDTDQQTVRILEPSVGVGNFIPLILKKFEGKDIILDVVDIDEHSLEMAKLILKNVLTSLKTVPSITLLTIFCSMILMRGTIISSEILRSIK